MAELEEDIMFEESPGFQGDPQPKLKESDRRKLDSIVQRMIANKETDDAIQFVVSDFKSKYATKALVENKPSQTAQPVAPTNPFFAKNPYDPRTKEGQAFAQANQPKIVEVKSNKVNQLAPLYNKTKAVANATKGQEKILQALNENDDVVDKVIRQQRFNAAGQQASLPTSDMPGLSNINLPKELRSEQVDEFAPTPEEVQLYKADAQQDELAARTLLKEVAKYKPEKKREIESSVYLVDAVRRAQQDPNGDERMAKINKNSEALNKGELIYDVRNGALLKPEGVVGSLLTGWKNKSQLFDDYSFLNSKSDDEIISELERRRTDFDPDEAMPVPKHKIAELSGMVGGMPLKSLVAGGVTAMIPGAQKAAPFVAGAVGARDFYQMGYAGALQSVYQQLRDEGKEPAEALAMAREQAKKEAAIDASVGAAMTFMGTRFGTKPVNFSQGYRQAAGTFLRGAGKEGALQGVVGAGGEVAKNLLAQEAGIKRETDANVLEAIESNFLLTVGMAAAARAGRSMQPKNYRSLLNGLSKVDDGLLETNIQSELDAGRITEEQANTIRNEVAEYKKLDSVIPENVTEEARLEIQQKIDKRDKLKQQMESQHESFHPTIKEKIKAIDEEINVLAQQKNPKQKISDEAKELKALVDSELDEGMVEGYAKDILKETAAADLPELMKDIAEQAKDPESASRTRATFGDAIVDKALEMFPLRQMRLLLSKQEIDVLPDAEKTSAIDDLIYGIQDANFDAFDRATGKPVVKGTYNLYDFLQKNDISGNETAKKLIDDLSKHPYFKNVKLYITDRMPEGVKGEAIVTAGLMKAGERIDAETLGHEMMHFLTSKILSNKYETLLPSEKRFKNAITGIVKQFDPDLSYLDKVLGRLGYKRSEYIQELIAEAFTGSWFAKELQGKEVRVIKTKRIDKNLIQKIIDKIIEYFGGKISDKTVSAEEKMNVVDALKDAFVNHGSASAERLKEINVPTGKYESLKSRTANAAEAIKRMLDAGFSKDEIIAEFSKRDISYSEEMFPLEEKKSSISVVMPEDVKKPDVVEVKATEVESTPQPETSSDPNWTFGKQDADASTPTPEGPEMIGITHAQMDNVARELGLETYAGDPETVAGWDAEARSRMQKDPDAMNKLFTKLRNGGTPDAPETRMMISYMADIKAKYNANPTPELLNDIKRAKDLFNIVGREQGKAFRARQGAVPVEETLADFHMRDVEYNKGAPLTEEQTRQSTKEYHDISAAQKALDEKVAKLEAENARLKADKKIKEESAKAKKGEKKDYKAERAQILDDIKRKWNESKGQASATFVPYAEQLIKIAPDVAKLMRNLVEEGITKLPEVVKAIHDQIRDVIPDVTEKDIHDIIAGEYNEKKSRTDIAEKLYDLRVEAKLINKLEALEAGMQPKNERQRIKRNQEIEELRRKIKELEGDAPKLASIKSKIKSEIVKLEEQLKKGDFKKEEKTPIELDKEALELKDKLIELKKEREIRLAQQEYNNRSFGKKAMDVVLAPFKEVRTIKSSFDLSAPLRQGVVPTAAELLTNPKKAVQRFGNMLKSARSEKFFDRWMNDLKESGAWRLMEESGLAIADPNNIQKAEEVFDSNYAKKYIPGVKGSERAYAYYLNSQRVDLFMKGVDIMADKGMTFKNSADQYKGWAEAVNSMTGRGKLSGPLANAAEALSVFFFSPRLMASRLAFFNPAFYAKIPKPLRRMVVKDLIKFISLGTAVASTIAVATDATVEEDPRSSDFAKIKSGDTRYDIWGGFQQYVRLFAQLLSFSKKTGSGEVKSLWERGARGDRELGNVVTTFLRSKASPLIGSITNVATGKTVVGERTDLETEAKKFLMPLLWEDTIEALADGDMQGVAHELAKIPPAIFGVGVQEYGARESSSNNRGERGERGKRGDRGTAN